VRAIIREVIETVARPDRGGRRSKNRPCRRLAEGGGGEKGIGMRLQLALGGRRVVVGEPDCPRERIVAQEAAATDIRSAKGNRRPMEYQREWDRRADIKPMTNNAVVPAARLMKKARCTSAS
jgi:hypothetical protein